MFRVVTDLAVFGFDEETRRMKVIALNPGVTREQVQENTGFELMFDAESASPSRRADHELDGCCASSIRSGSTRLNARQTIRMIGKRRDDMAWQALSASRHAISRPIRKCRTRKALVDYGVRMEQLGFDSLWVWDHVLLGVDPNFPIIDSLTLLTAIAARTTRIKLGTGILVLPLRNPVVLAKQLVEHGPAVRWPSAHGHGVGLVQARVRCGRRAVRAARQDHGREPRDPDPLLDRGHGQGRVRTYHKIPAGVMYPKPAQKPRPPILIGGYVDRVLKRAAVSGDGWLTYFYRPESFAKSWAKIRAFAGEGGKDPDTLLNAAQLPIMIGKSRAAVESRMMDWLGKEWDYASWSESTKDSAIIGTVDECVAQFKEHLAAGVQKLIFVPYKYEMEQIEIIATRDHSAGSGPERR